MLSVVEETERSIRAAVADRTIDEEISAGLLAAIRLVAEQLDHPDFPIVNGKLDNVSLPTYLRYCDALRLTPASRAAQAKEDGGGKLAQLRSISGGRDEERPRKRAAVKKGSA